MKHVSAKPEKGDDRVAQKSANTAVSPDAVQQSDATAEALVQPVPISITPAELDALKERAKQADENWNRFLRAAADHENYKKRALREKDEAVQRAKERIIGELLLAVDAMEKGLASTSNGGANNSLAEGMKLVHAMLSKILRECGTEEVTAIGVKFNPELHHAMAQESSETVAQDVVIREVRKGYRVGDRILRAAEVVVSSGPSASAGNES